MTTRAKSTQPLSSSELELRIKNLEEKVLSQKESKQIDNTRLDLLESKLDALIDCLNKNSSVTSHCPKNSEGKRQIQL